VADEATPKRVIVYAAPNAKEPFNDWLNNLRDVMGRKRILARVARLEQGNYGDCESVGDGVKELRLFLVVATGFILVKKMAILLFFYVVGTRIVKIRISNRQRYIGRSI
jgi:putative addiction module killer protein